MSCAKGKFLYFMDGDDKIEKNMLESLYSMSLFVYTGAYLKKRKFNFDKIIWSIALVGIIVLILEVFFDVWISIAQNYYKYTIVSIIGAVLISYDVVCVSKLLHRFSFLKRILCFYGNNSIIILCLHLIELNNTPWYILYNAMTLYGVPGSIQHICIFVLKLLFMAVAALIILKFKILRKIFNK